MGVWSLNAECTSYKPTTLAEEHEVEAKQNCGVLSFIDWACMSATQDSAYEAHTINHLHDPNPQVARKHFRWLRSFYCSTKASLQIIKIASMSSFPRGVPCLWYHYRLFPPNTIRTSSRGY